MTTHRPTPALFAACAVLLGAVVAVYLPGLDGPFLFDDFPNFVDHPLTVMPRLDAESLRNAALGNDSGPLGRPLAALSFALNYWFAGQAFDAFWFKLTNVLVHGANALLVFWLAGRLLAGRDLRGVSPRALALLVALGWALHPLQLTSVLYVVQRMTSLSAACVLLGALLYVVGRQRLAERRPGAAALMLAGLFGGVTVGTLFKESALLLPLYLGVLEYTAFERRALATAARRFVHGLFATVVLAPGVLVLGAFALRTELFTAAFGGRDFTLWERLLTQGRVLFEYVGLVLVPRLDALSLFHDDVVVSRSLLDPPQTLLALAGWLVVAVVAVAGWRRGARLLPFAVGWFLAGHAMESTVFPLEMMHEHRNYLASLGPIAAVLVGAGVLLARTGQRTAIVTALVGALAVAPAAVTVARAAQWRDADTLIAAMLRKDPGSARVRQAAAQRAFVRGAFSEAYEHLRQSALIEPRHGAPLVGMLRIAATVHGAIETGQLVVDATPVAVPDRYDAPLEPQADYLAVLTDLLDAELGRRLATGPLAAGDRAALAQYRVCVQAGAADCRRLVPRALEWFRVLYERGDLPPTLRAAMAADRGRVLETMARLDEAREWMARAWALSQDDPQVLVLRAVLELRLGELDAAAASTREVAALGDRVGIDSTQLRELQAAVARARAASPEPGAAVSGAPARAEHAG